MIFEATVVLIIALAIAVFLFSISDGKAFTVFGVLAYLILLANILKEIFKVAP